MIVMIIGKKFGTVHLVFDKIMVSFDDYDKFHVMLTHVNGEKKNLYNIPLA